MSIFSILENISQKNPEKPALLAHGRRHINYSELCGEINQIASQLKNYGIKETDSIAIVLPNSPELALVTLGAMAIAIAAPTNPDYRETEYSLIFERLKPRLLITLADIEHPSKKAAFTLGIDILEIEIESSVSLINCKFTKLKSDADYSLMDMPALDNVALIMLTSGTTSKSKIVPLTHGNLLASAKNLEQSLRLTKNDRTLHFLPMFHIGGIVDVLLTPLISGGSVVCCKSFSAPEFFRDLKFFEPTWVQAVPIMIEEILLSKEDYFSENKSHSLKFLRSVSAPLSITLMQKFESEFKIPVIEIFGMTETAGVITSNPLPPKKRKPGSVGIPAGTDVKIINESGQALGPGQAGQVVVSGNNVMRGYLHELNDSTGLNLSGMLCTGDIGYFDSEGYLFLSGRIKDIINRGGEKISPMEVDRVLLNHPDLADAACFAVPHATLSEDIAAIVVMKENKLFDSEAILIFLRDQLAYFKIPRFIMPVEHVLRNNGKLQRAKLSELYAPSLIKNERVNIDFAKPESLVAKNIALIWGKILKKDAIGIYDNFFDIGGDSLKAASFINSMQQDWGETIYVSSIFDAPTIQLYEKYLHRHYPEICARMLGFSVTLKESSEAPVTMDMIDDLRKQIAHPKPTLNKPLRKNPRAVFVLSAPRSGSTLLRVMLAGNPKLFSPPELYLLSFDTMADRKSWYSGSLRFQLEGNVRALLELQKKSLEDAQKLISDLEKENVSVHEYYRILQDWLDERILTDKTPAYAISIDTLKRAEDCFDNPYYIHLVRHPYGMIRSFEEAKLEQLWYPRLFGEKVYGTNVFPYNRRQLAEMIWYILNENIIKFLHNIPSQRRISFHFEGIVSQPEKEMRRLCDGIGIPYEAGMINPQQEKSSRMTDGIHKESRMIGDPKFHKHNKINPAIADQWKLSYDSDFLSKQTFGLAKILGYEETIASVQQRTNLDL